MSSVTSTASATSIASSSRSPSPVGKTTIPSVVQRNLAALLLGRQALHPNPSLFSPGLSGSASNMALQDGWQIVGSSWSSQSTAGSNFSQLSSSTTSVNQGIFISPAGSVSSDWELVEANPPVTPPNTPNTPNKIFK